MRDYRHMVATYTHDTLNRVTFLDYPGTDDDVAFRYDAPLGGEPPCPFGRGRLCRALTQGENLSYGYDAYGNVVDQPHQINNVNHTLRYSFDAGNSLKTITYPSGMIVTYVRDAAGRIKDITRTAGGVTTPLVSNRTYRADGLLKNQLFGNALPETRVYDQQGRLTIQSVGSIYARSYPLYDANGNLQQLSATGFGGLYTYDPLDRLKQDLPLPGSAHSFDYDGNGNRRLDNTVPYLYTPNTNRLSSVGGTTVNMDATGNILSDASGRSFTYDNAGRLKTATVNGSTTSYSYNAFGQRTQKTRPNVPAVYYYTGLHGELLAETESNGSPIVEYVYADNTPVAQVRYAQDPGTAPPTVTGFWPGAGTTNITVFVFGSGFVPGSGATTVKVNGISAPLMQVLSPDLLLFLLPTGNTNGPIQVTTAQGTATSANNFGTALTGVQITGLWPALGPVNTITFVFGSGFVLNQTQVSVNQTPAPLVQVLDNSLLFAFVPLGATTGPISVTTALGSASSATPFTVLGTSVPAGTTVTYLHTDHLGAPRAGTDQNGIVTWRWEGTAFGDTPPNEDPDGDSKKTTINIAWPGTYRDQESQLYLNGARYFDAKTWRFLTPDPTSVMEHFERWRSRMGVPGEPPFEANPYVRVLNNPLRWVDTTGESAAGAVCGALGLPPSICEGTVAGAGSAAAAAAAGAATTLYSPEACPQEHEERCAKEWEEAYATCAKEMKRGGARGVTGGYANEYDCARGLVSQRCGGNRID